MKKWKRIINVIMAIALFSGNLQGISFHKSEMRTSNVVKASVKSLRTKDSKTHSRYVDGVYWLYQVQKLQIVVHSNGKDNGKVQTVDCAVNVRLHFTDKKNIVVPSSIDGYRVYEIGVNAFANNKDITDVTIPITVERICDNAFENCTNLKNVKFIDAGNSNSTGNIIDESESAVEAIGDYVFKGCTALETMPIKSVIFSEECSVDYIGIGIYAGCTKLKEVALNSKAQEIHVPDYTFYQCSGIKELKIDSNITNISFGERAFFGCGFHELVFPCNVKFYGYAFYDVKNLSSITFEGNVSCDENGTYAFGSCFRNPNGENKAIFRGEKVALGIDFFRYGDFLEQVSFENPKGMVSLDYKSFGNCSIKNIEFNCKDVIVKDGGLESLGNNLQEITFHNTGTTTLENAIFYSAFRGDEKEKNQKLEKINFSCDKVKYVADVENKSENNTFYGLENSNGIEILYDENVNTIIGNVNSKGIENVKKIFIENPKVYYDLVMPDGDYTVYSYSNIERDIRKNLSKISYEHIQNKDLVATYNETYVVNEKGIDLTKLHVKTKLKNGKEITLEPAGILKSSDSVENIEFQNKYYVQYGAELENYEGTMQVMVYYEDASTVLHIPVVKKKAEELLVEWNWQTLNNLVVGMPIKASEVVSKASVIYNDGTQVSVSPEEIVLNMNYVINIDNTLVAKWNKNVDLSANVLFKAKENVVTSVEAVYEKEKSFVGESIDLEMIKIYADYLYDNKNLNKQVLVKRISPNTLTKLGENTIRVYYTEELFDDIVINADEIIPISINAEFDTRYKCYEGNSSISKDAIRFTVTYNNGNVVEKSKLNEEFDISITAKTKGNLLAVVKYKNLVSNEFLIPLTENKVVEIVPTTGIKNVVAGKQASKDWITSISVIYANGEKKTLTGEQLKETEWDIRLENEIYVDQWNTVLVTYKGVTGVIVVWGILDVQSNAGVPTPITTIIPTIMPTKEETNIENSYSPTPLVTVQPTQSNPTNTKEDVSVGPNEQDPVNNNMATPGIEVDSDNIPSTQVKVGKLKCKWNTSKINLTNEITYKKQFNKSLVCNLEGAGEQVVKYQLVYKGKNVREDKWKDAINNKITVKSTKNKYAILYMRYVEENGNYNTIHTNGFRIDKVKPTVNVKNGKIYKFGHKLIFKDTAGIKYAKLNGKKVTTGKKLKKRKQYTLIIMDKAGNKKKIVFKVK